MKKRTACATKTIRTETTGICANHGNLEDLELKHALDTEVHVLPFTIVVAELAWYRGS